MATKDIIQSLVDNDHITASELINSSLLDRANEYIQSRKVDIGSSLFNSNTPEEVSSDEESPEEEWINETHHRANRRSQCFNWRKGR